MYKLVLVCHFGSCDLSCRVGADSCRKLHILQVLHKKWHWPEGKSKLPQPSCVSLATIQ